MIVIVQNDSSLRKTAACERLNIFEYRTLFKNIQVKGLIMKLFKITLTLISVSLVILSIVEYRTLSPYKSRLYSPTFLTKINDNYFIVDSWHHRIIYSTSLENPISQWKVLTDHIAGPHSIVSDGNILITEDTGRHRLFVFKKAGANAAKEYVLTQTIDNMGKRPHRVIYDQQTKLFYIIASISQQIIAIKDDNGTAEVVYKKYLPFLKGAYTREIRIMDGKMAFVAGPGKITFTTYKDGNYNVIQQFNVPRALSNMNDIIKINDYYYITATPRTFLRVKDLADLTKGKYENLMQVAGYKGTPYFFNEVDGRIFLPQTSRYSGITSFIIKNDQITDVINHPYFGRPTVASKIRRKEFPA